MPAFTCSFCSAPFEERAEYMGHLREHMKKRAQSKESEPKRAEAAQRTFLVWQCDKCEAGFGQKHELDAHRVAQHDFVPHAQKLARRHVVADSSIRFRAEDIGLGAETQRRQEEQRRREERRRQQLKRRGKLEFSLEQLDVLRRELRCFRSVVPSLEQCERIRQLLPRDDFDVPAADVKKWFKLEILRRLSEHEASLEHSNNAAASARSNKFKHKKKRSRKQRDNTAASNTLLSRFGQREWIAPAFAVCYDADGDEQRILVQDVQRQQKALDFVSETAGRSTRAHNTLPVRLGDHANSSGVVAHRVDSWVAPLSRDRQLQRHDDHMSDSDGEDSDYI